MRLIIEIPDEEYELVRHGNKSYRTELELMNAVANGKPLPEHHGRLGDLDALEDEIKRLEKAASDYEFNLKMHQNNVMHLSVNDIERMQEHASENRQRAEWLRELKAYRSILANALDMMFDRYGAVEVNVDKESESE